MKVSLLVNLNRISDSTVEEENFSVDILTLDTVGKSKRKVKHSKKRFKREIDLLTASSASISKRKL